MLYRLKCGENDILRVERRGGGGLRRGKRRGGEKIIVEEYHSAES